MIVKARDQITGEKVFRIFNLDGKVIGERKSLEEANQLLKEIVKKSNSLENKLMLCNKTMI